ncbi:MAG: polysaccharide deacetylase [Gelidibacter sp.]|uniref:polysaccharide deacetylase n=1 Tax=Gelidibacter sp. TaxID=2018083 RepID=UPI0032659253
MDEGHELASHLCYHSDYNPDHVLSSKQKLEEISGTKIVGIRSPRLKTLDSHLIKEAGYHYDSSLNPTYIPNRYNNFNKSRKIVKHIGIIIVPFSVATLFRIPLFWLSFKNMALKIYLFFCLKALKKDGYLHLYFHPWEFADLNEFDIPVYIKKISGDKMCYKFDTFLQKIKKEGDFTTIRGFLTDIKI